MFLLGDTIVSVKDFCRCSSAGPQKWTQSLISANKHKAHSRLTLPKELCALLPVSLQTRSTWLFRVAYTQPTNNHPPSTPLWFICISKHSQTSGFTLAQTRLREHCLTQRLHLSFHVSWKKNTWCLFCPYLYPCTAVITATIHDNNSCKNKCKELLLWTGVEVLFRRTGLPRIKTTVWSFLGKLRLTEKQMCSLNGIPAEVGEVQDSIWEGNNRLMILLSSASQMWHAYLYCVTFLLSFMISILSHESKIMACHMRIERFCLQ